MFKLHNNLLNLLLSVLLGLAPSGVRGGTGGEGLGEGGGQSGGGVPSAVPGQSKLPAQLEVVVFDGLIASFQTGCSSALLHLDRDRQQVNRLSGHFITSTHRCQAVKRETLADCLETIRSVDTLAETMG